MADATALTTGTSQTRARGAALVSASRSTRSSLELWSARLQSQVRYCERPRHSQAASSRRATGAAGSRARRRWPRRCRGDTTRRQLCWLLHDRADDGARCDVETLVLCDSDSDDAVRACLRAQRGGTSRAGRLGSAHAAQGSSTRTTWARACASRPPTSTTTSEQSRGEHPLQTQERIQGIQQPITQAIGICAAEQVYVQIVNRDAPCTKRSFVSVLFWRLSAIASADVPVLAAATSHTKQ